MRKKRKKPAKKGEGNRYDKIFRENAVVIFRPLLERVLGIVIVSLQPEVMEFLKTHEREVDFMYRVKTEEGKELLLHLEFQTTDNREMIYRVSEYHGMALRAVRLPQKHVVVYLGKKKPRMRTKLRKEEVFSGFDLIYLHELDPSQFLISQVPEEIILAILCNFPPEKVESILRMILIQLKQVCKSKNELSKYLQQLIILSNIRKFERETIKTVNDMSLIIDIENSYVYQLGVEKMEAVVAETESKLKAEEAKRKAEEAKRKAEEAKRKAEEVKRKKLEEKVNDTIAELIQLGTLTDKRIASMFGVSLYRIRKIKSTLKKTRK